MQSSGQLLKNATLELFKAGCLMAALGVLPGQAMAAADPQVVPGEFVVRVSGGAIELIEPAAGKRLGAVRAGSGSALEKLATRHKLAGAERLTKSGKKGQKSASVASDMLRLVFPADVDASSVMQELKQLPGVVAVEPNYAGSLCYVPSDPLYSVQQATDFGVVGMPDAWQVQAGASASVVVAVIDSGAETIHPDLASALDVANSYNFVDNNTNIVDDIGHGTRVAGIIGASGNNGTGIAGVAFGCKILSLDVTDTTGVVTTARVISALDWAVSHGAHIANMSLRFSANSQSLEAACDDAAAAGVVLVGAAGNDNQGSSPVYPASYDTVIGVGAIADDGVSRAPYSNYNGTYMTLVDLVAPGDTMFSSIPGSQYNGSYGSGTSFAAPVVSGVAALLKAKYPTQSAGAIRQHLQITANTAVATWSTYGRVNAKAALETAMTPSVSVASVTVDDSTAYSGTNNADGTLDKGETVKLIVSLKNDAADATTVNGTLATTDGLITINDSAGNWGTVANGKTTAATDVYTTVVLSGASTAHTIPFTINVSANGGSYTPILAFNVQSENTASIGASSFFTPQTWTSGNTYEVAGNLNFNIGSSLTINPGTIVKLGPGVNLNINNGTLTANGSASQPILFTSTRSQNAFTPITSSIGPQNVPVNLGSYSQVRYVDGTGGSDLPGNGSSANPWRSMSYAISQITDSAVGNKYALLVAEGKYIESVFAKAYVDMYGGFEPSAWTRDIFIYSTVLDGAYIHVPVTTVGPGVGDNWKVDGFVVVRGAGAGVGTGDNVTISNNIICNTYGRQITSGPGSVVISHNLIISGIDTGSASSGGGVYYNTAGTITITDNVFLGNPKSCISIESNSTAIIARNYIADTPSNGSFRVGVLDLNNSGAGSTVNNNFIVDNNVVGIGCTASVSAPVMYNNTVVNNAGGAITAGGSITVRNSILRGGASGSMTADHCNVQGGWPGAGNIDADPRFLGQTLFGVGVKLEFDSTRWVTKLTNSDSSLPPSLQHSAIKVGSKWCFVLSSSASEMILAGDVTQGGAVHAPIAWSCYDYHLLASSPCIDTGTNSGAPTSDIEGDPRPLNGGISLTTDMGADEARSGGVLSTYAPGGSIHIFSPASGSSLKYCTVENTLGVINDSSSSQFQNCIFQRNSGDGLNSTAGSGSVTTCTAVGNIGKGLAVGSRPIDDSTAKYNQGDGLTGAAITNSVAISNIGKGLIGSTVSNCSASSNDSDGIIASGAVSGSTSNDNVANGIVCSSGNVSASTALGNASDGITISGGGTVNGSNGSQNGGRGIVTNGSTIANCTVTSNALGGVSGSGSSSLTSATVSSNGGTAVSGVNSIADTKITDNASGVSGATSIGTSYIAGNVGNGTSGGNINSSALIGNGSKGANTPASVSNSWVVGNSSVGIDSPTGNVTNSSIRRNGSYGVRNMSVSGLLNTNNLYENGTYDYYDNTNTLPGGLKDCRFNYWGTGSTSEMSGSPWPGPANVTRIFDGFENGQSPPWYANWGQSGEFALTAVPNAPDSTPPAFLLDVTPNLSNAVNVGATTFTLVFSKAMNTSINPAVTFGLTSPFESRVVEPSPGWINSTSWQGSFWIQSDTGDGLSTLRVSNATANDGFVIPDDTMHKFTVDTTGAGTANNGLVVTVGSATTVNLSWSENEKPGTALGYSVHRSTMGAEGPFQRITPSLLTTPAYTDNTASSNSTYFYVVYIETTGNDATQWTPANYAITVPVALSSWAVE